MAEPRLSKAVSGFQGVATLLMWIVHRPLSMAGPGLKWIMVKHPCSAVGIQTYLAVLGANYIISLQICTQAASYIQDFTSGKFVSNAGMFQPNC
ncbi:hypothetical protein CEXT_437381 [Caerostris extrusa]|uniref:Uncharacterized protein n=1 Tax=Caerostris extrusa TaxID=172846 RepID=A0AAV4S5T7_CAEEX|nr:hypothetical protein CEXT_437381 [Caerostris extrusa]